MTHDEDWTHSEHWKKLKSALDKFWADHPETFGPAKEGPPEHWKDITNEDHTAAIRDLDEQINSLQRQKCVVEIAVRERRTILKCLRVAHSERFNSMTVTETHVFLLQIKHWTEYFTETEQELLAEDIERAIGMVQLKIQGLKPK